MIYNYNTIFPPSPIVCSPLPLLSLPIPHPMMPLMPEQRQTHTHTHTSSLSNNNPPPERKISPSKNRCVLQFQRPASQATSVKAEPGSGMGSIASVNRVSTSILIIILKSVFCSLIVENIIRHLGALNNTALCRYVFE